MNAAEPEREKPFSLLSQPKFPSRNRTGRSAKPAILTKPSGRLSAFLIGRLLFSRSVCEFTDTPDFECILDRVSGAHTGYFMPEPRACPRCKATVSEKTLVEWDGGIEVGLT